MQTIYLFTHPPTHTEREREIHTRSCTATLWSAVTNLVLHGESVKETESESERMCDWVAVFSWGSLSCEVPQKLPTIADSVGKVDQGKKTVRMNAGL